MTFSIVAFSKSEKKLGLAIASCGLFTGDLCPIVCPRASFIGTAQAYVSKSFKSKLTKIVASGVDLNQLNIKEFTKEFIEYRQAAIIDTNGGVFAHTGVNTSPYSNHLIKDSFIVAGNMLASKECLDSMAKEFESKNDLPFEDKLVKALQSARAAGGQVADGKPLKERSGALYITSRDPSQNLSLRVDMCEDAIDSLRDLLTTQTEYEKLLAAGEIDPEDLPSLSVQEKKLVKAPSIFK